MDSKDPHPRLRFLRKGERGSVFEVREDEVRLLTNHVGVVLLDHNRARRHRHAPERREKKITQKVLLEGKKQAARTIQQREREEATKSREIETEQKTKATTHLANILDLQS
jgi:hypothetical protein